MYFIVLQNIHTYLHTFYKGHNSEIFNSNDTIEIPRRHFPFLETQFLFGWVGRITRNQTKKVE